MNSYAPNNPSLNNFPSGSAGIARAGRVRRFAALALLGAAVLAVRPAAAATYSWNTNDGTWDTSSANWSGAGTTWVDGNDAVFTNTATLSTITLNGTISATSVQFGRTADNNANYSLTSGTLNDSGTLVVQGSSANNWGNYGTFPAVTINSDVNVAGSTLLGQAKLIINGNFATSLIAANPGGDYGSLIISGGTVTATNGIDKSVASLFRVDLNGGTLYTPFINSGSWNLWDTYYWALFFNGAVVKATTNTANFIPVTSSPAYISNGGAILDTDGYNITIGANLANANGQTGTLTKQGAGTLTLSGSNTFTGATSVNGGTLKVATGSGTRCASDVTIADTAGCVFGVQLAAANGQWISSGSLTVGGSDSEIDIDYGSTAPTTSTSQDPIVVSALTVGVGKLKILSGDIFQFEKGSTYPLINFTSTGPAEADPYTGLTLSLPAGITGHLKTIANHVELMIDSTTKRDWNSGSTNWDTGTPWLDGGIEAAFADGDFAYLGDASGVSGNPTLTISGASVSPAAVVMNSASHDYTIAGNPIATGTLTVNAPSRSLTLTGANTYSGGTTINAGTLMMGNGTALGTGAVTVGASGVLSVDVASGAIGALSGSAGGRITGGTAGAITLTSSSASNTTFAGVITNGLGTLSFVKAGSGTLTLTGANAYTGSTTVNSGGTLALGTGGSLTVDAASIWTVAGTFGHISGTTHLLPGNVVLNNGTLTGDNAIYGGAFYVSGYNINVTANGSANTISSRIGLLANSLILNTPLATDALSVSGSIGLTDSPYWQGYMTKSGLGTVTLSGTNRVTPWLLPGVVINAGTLTLNTQVGQLDMGTWGMGMNGGTFNMDNTGANGAFTQACNIIYMDVAGDNTLKLTRIAEYDQVMTVSSFGARYFGGTLNFVNGGGVNGAANGFNLTGMPAGLMSSWFFYGGSNYAWMDGAGTFVRGIDYAIDTGAESITASTAAFTAGRLYEQVTGSGEITAQTDQTITTLNIDNANNFTLAGGATLTVNGILKSGGGSSTISGGTGIRAALDTELIIRTDGASDTLTISNNILANHSNTGNYFTKSGAGKLTLSGLNAYIGHTYVNGGILSISANNNIGLTSWPGIVYLKGGTLQATATFGLYNGTPGSNNRGVVLANAAGIDVTGGNTLTVAGVVSGTGGLTKTGAGTLLLTGANTYAGGTTISNGTLLVDGSITGAVTVVSGATLGGTGTVYGAVSCEGTILVSTNAAGGVSGPAVTGSMTLLSGSTLAFDTASSNLLNSSSATRTIPLATGGLIGTFTTLQLPPSWKASYENGSVVVTKSYPGTLMKIQ
jgi:fibronectin-binding autotransporter adhesin